MQLLATLKATDVEDNLPDFDYTSFRPRTAGRAVIFDGEKVALIHVKKHGYYMLPGGGIDDENLSAGLAREIRQELGCEVEITSEVGSTIIYMDRWSTKQTDYCYTAKKIGITMDRSPTDFETEEGHEIVWADNLAEAIQLVEAAAPANRDGKLVRARDLLFLEIAQAS